MTNDSQVRIKPVTIVLTVAAAITSVLGITVAVAYYMRPRPITIDVTDPRGAVILTDLVIDGRPESRRDIAPLTYVLHGRDVEFAVIPESRTAGRVRVELTGGRGQKIAAGAGIRGTASIRPGGGGVSIGGMTSEHVANMRASRTESSASMDDSPDAENSSDAGSRSSTRAR